MERNKSFPDRAKRAAEAFLVSVESDKLSGSYVDPQAGRTLFAVLAEKWLRTAVMDESTRETTEFRVRKHLIPYFREVVAIKPSDVLEWDRNLATRGLALSTRSVLFAHLRTILGVAQDDGMIGKNPCSARSVTQPRPKQRRVVPWELPTLVKIRAGLAVRYRPIVDVGGGCGLRQGEIFGLGEDAPDFEAGRLNVVRQIKIVRNTVINRHWFDPKVWNRAVAGAGFERSRATGLHALRHFYASTQLEAGVSIKALAEYLGHSDPGFTLRVYTHLLPSSETRARQAVDELFQGAWEIGPTDPGRPTDGPEAGE